MRISTYRASVRVFVKTLGNPYGITAEGASFAAEREIPRSRGTGFAAADFGGQV